jgi:GT2 family glycosyltransferase
MEREMQELEATKIAQLPGRPASVPRSDARRERKKAGEEARNREQATREPVTVAVINFNGMKVLPDTLAALRRLVRQPDHIYVLDDNSTDGSADWAERNHPEVEVVRLAGPGGRPSRLRNWALRHATSPYVLLLDNDLTLEPDCLSRLVETMRGRPDVLACFPSLVCSHDPDLLYRRGNEIHYLGIATDTSRGERRRREQESEAPFPSIPGGNGLVNREAAARLGYFDEAYRFGWGEDSELFARGLCEGHRTLLVPNAIAHHVERPRGMSRGEAQLYNRYRFLLIHYSRRSLFLLGPALLLFETALLAGMMAKGLGPAYTRALRQALRDRKEMMARRRVLQGRRSRPDSAVLVGGDFVPAGALAESRLVGLAATGANAIFGAYWTVVRRWI